MDKFCKKYIGTVQSLFPFRGKNEKKYLKDLQINMEDYCDEHSTSSMEELYEEFGFPHDVVNSYFSTIDIDYIIKKIHMTKIVKRISFCLFILVSVISITLATQYAYAQYKARESFERESVFFTETEITTGHMNHTNK